MASAKNPQKSDDMNLLMKLYKREINGSERCHRKARPYKFFKKIPIRLCYRLSSLVPESVLESEGYVFLGFTKCGQFVVSYSCQIGQIDDDQLLGAHYIYKLQWWWFVPSRPLIKVSEVQLFGEQEIQQDLYILFCEWPEDRSQVLVFGHGYGFPSVTTESCNCYLTVTAIPTLAPCKSCTQLSTGGDGKKLCLKHCFCVHTKYELTIPFPVFYPKVQLKRDGQVILNTGDSIVALHIDLDGIESKPKGPLNDISVLKVKEGLVSDKSKDNLVCTSPEPSREFVWSTNGSSVPPDIDSGSLEACMSSDRAAEQPDILDTLFNVNEYRESQKENTSNNGQDIRLDRIKSPPKSPKNNLSQRSAAGFSGEKWYESQTLPHGTTSPGIAVQSTSRRVRANSTEMHTKDLYNFDSDDSEDNSYSFMCPSVPKVALKSKSPGGTELQSHPHNVVLSPSVHAQRQLAFTINKASPLLNNSQALNCDSPRPSSYEVVVANRGLPGLQRSFFSPSNSENSFGGTSSSAESVIVQVNDSRTVTHSWRKFSYHGDTAVDSTLVIEDDFDLSYGSVLPVEVRGTKNRKLALSLDPANDGNKEQICIKQLTFDIEHYMEEAIRSTAKWADRYGAFTNYDLQILDVNMEKNEVLAKVFALVTARDEAKPRKFYKKSKSQEKLYQTSLTFEVNMQSGVYETLAIEDLKLLDEKCMRGKEWKPGFHECAWMRRQVIIPQSTKRSVQILTNEAVFRGKSLQMMVFPENFLALVL